MTIWPNVRKENNFVTVWPLCRLQSYLQEQVSEALKYISADRLILAPDCGLGLLPEDVLRQKLKNMCAAAKAVPVTDS